MLEQLEEASLRQVSAGPVRMTQKVGVNCYVGDNARD